MCIRDRSRIDENDLSEAFENQLISTETQRNNIPNIFGFQNQTASQVNSYLKISISIPEKLAERLDRQVGKGRKAGRSASITKMIEDSLNSNQKSPPKVLPEQLAAIANEGEVRVEEDTMGVLEVPADRY